MSEFLFYKMGKIRDKAETMHDILIVAKDGIKRIPLMYGTNMAWKPMEKMLRIAEAAGLIEKVEVPPSYTRKKPKPGWKTTVKGLKYAKSIYDNHKLFLEDED